MKTEDKLQILAIASKMNDYGNTEQLIENYNSLKKAVENDDR